METIFRIKSFLTAAALYLEIIVGIFTSTSNYARPFYPLGDATRSMMGCQLQIHTVPSSNVKPTIASFGPGRERASKNTGNHDEARITCHEKSPLRNVPLFRYCAASLGVKSSAGFGHDIFMVKPILMVP
jgi:hypothetical protein